MSCKIFKMYVYIKISSKSDEKDEKEEEKKKQMIIKRINRNV